MFTQISFQKNINKIGQHQHKQFSLGLNIFKILLPFHKIGGPQIFFESITVLKSKIAKKKDLQCKSLIHIYLQLLFLNKHLKPGQFVKSMFLSGH